MSRPSLHGPSSGVAEGCSSLARCAARESAEGGRPSTSALSVRVSEKALVASRRLFEKEVERSASRRRLLLNFSLASPSRPTPESCIDLAAASTMRSCAGSSSLPPCVSAVTARKTAADWLSLVVVWTTCGCIAECASRSSSELLTPMRWPTTPQMYSVGLSTISIASITAEYEGAGPSEVRFASSAEKSDSSLASTASTPGLTSAALMASKSGSPSC
mmetsp:Transcript_42196/g.90007  ORF Transcript_42196/g.90007 Transcript_42196/m.90007 type:complete len:218 (+) Transcript_42196:1884-2537(+)